MGALAALTKWIPEDDLLLKNAVEAGASLESLAKGAVHFSRRYTITELQDRWRSLLYDLDTSAEASARIIEIEIELSVSNAPKANRLTGSKGKEIPGKRKGGSVRSHYFAMRKRVCSEPCNSANLGLLEPSSLISTGNGVGYRHFKPQIGDCVTAINSEFQEPSPNHYDHLEIAYESAQDILHDIAMLGSAAVDASVDTADRFHTDSIDDDFPDGIADNDCLFQYTESDIPSVDKLEAGNAHQTFHHDFVPSDMPQSAIENMSSPNLYQNLHETGLPQTLPESSLYGHDGVKTESLPDFDPSISGQEQLCSGFEGKDDLSSQVPEHGESFDRLRCSSSQAGIPVWETIDGISPPTIGIDGHFGDNQGANSLLDFHDITEMHSPGCHGAISDTELQDRIPDGALDSARIVVENEYMGASSSYMNFADDEFLLINMDEDIADRSSLNGLNSILLSSPSDAQQDIACISSGPDVKEAADTCPTVNDAAYQGDSNDLLEEFYPANADDDNVCIAGGNEPSTSVRIPHNTEPTEGFMFCALNTEDTEIPCNDDVCLPCLSLPSSPSDVEHSPMEKHLSISSSGEFLLDDGRSIAQPFASSVKTGFSNIGLLESSDGCRTETRSIENESRAAASRCAGVSLGDPNSCNSMNACLYPSSQSAQKQENAAKNLGKHGSLDLFLQKPAQVSDLAMCNANHYKEEANMHETLQGRIQYQEQSHAEMTIGDMEKSMSKSDQEDHFSDSDCDVPNFSDIEAMILDMDLDPQDQDSSLFTKEVSRYQCAQTKKAIVRLEQGAHSYIQRAMSSHKAFAVLYGRHLKHYIKSPKVSLGRATEDMKVDIDLSREGRSKKISRRQAIIKMEKDGSFFLTNVGKGSIFINSKEVPAEKRTKLTSGCLIEIRGMRFIFEVNQNSVQHYLNNIQGKQEEDSKFDWTHDQNHQIS
ncbi:Microspherule protein N-terminal domain-containing protein [Dioscorea alata]|uniref:Microspherule protein N-terminal domain-containing protein n=2 Tax=Dioscorea alata TaxID=55571 RepID=A0ACB7U9D4_DIOAL|nr:Microspherule protein N-terminal domain-containing protein [Dioscorea alata]KAH7656939.1 Microspherule protein N-terminal domain-containing protein [Dioscorea alata]